MKNFRADKTSIWLSPLLIVPAVVFSIALVATAETLAGHCDDECGNQCENTCRDSGDCICCIPAIQMIPAIRLDYSLNDPPSFRAFQILSPKSEIAPADDIEHPPRNPR